MWEIEFTKQAEREFWALPFEVQDRVAVKMDQLVKSFTLRGSKKLTDRGDTYRFRMGAYRVIYEVLKRERRIVVTAIVKRGQAGLYD